MESARIFQALKKIWKTFSDLGDVAFAYTFCFVLIKIQINSTRKQTNEKATTIGIMASTVFYMLCGVLGYIAFGNDASLDVF
nr:amino acid permease 6-like [Tanacetum cinerariifolium]